MGIQLGEHDARQRYRKRRQTHSLRRDGIGDYFDAIRHGLVLYDTEAGPNEHAIKHLSGDLI